MALRLVAGEIFAGGLSGVIATLIGCTGLAGGTGRYGAILLGATPDEIDRATAFGFFWGLGVGCLAILFEFTT
jgi:hypothetical protein